MDRNGIEDKEDSVMVTVFTIDVEEWSDALHISNNIHTSCYILGWLQPLLEKHNIHPIAYCLEKRIEWVPYTWEKKTHGRYHRWWENADRRPYQWLGFTGGFWFRILPLWFIRNQVLKHGHFYCHFHDFDEEHPKLNNPLMNWKRHVGLKGAKKKLEALLASIDNWN